MKIARLHFVTTGNDGESERLHTITAEDLEAWRRGEKHTEGAQAIRKPVLPGSDQSTRSSVKLSSLSRKQVEDVQKLEAQHEEQPTSKQQDLREPKSDATISTEERRPEVERPSFFGY